jgi:FkbM family methyltransferase
MVEDVSEQVFDLNVIRRMHIISLARFDFPGQIACWGEWNHPNEGSRTLDGLVNGLIADGWARLIRPGATCIDIGAHSGDTAIPMGLFCADFRRNIRGRVFAVEPNPDVFAVLKINAILNNHICDFVPIQMAIIKEPYGSVVLSDHGNANCNGGIVDENFGAELQAKLRAAAQIAFTADGISLENFYKDKLSISDQRNLSFIKIDCEGYDKEILRSSKEFLQGVRPTIFVEWFDMFKVIGELGYEAFEGHSQRPATPQNKVNDLILLPHTR